MWYLKKIPKTAYFYWGDIYMPWIRYLTLKTFRYHNPDWKMVLWTKHVPTGAFRPTKENWFKTFAPCEAAGINLEYWSPLKWNNNWWSKVEALGVEVRPTDIENALKINLSYLQASMRDMAGSDYLRWFLFSTVGGLWADMDILFFKSIEKIEVNVLKNEKTLAVLLQKPYNNLLLSAPEAPFFKACLEAALRLTPPQLIEYAGTAGPPTYASIPESVDCVVMPKETTEVFDSTRDAFDKVVQGIEVPYQSVGVHWHGSGLTGTYMDIIPENYLQQLTVIGRSVQCAMRFMKEK